MPGQNDPCRGSHGELESGDVPRFITGERNEGMPVQVEDARASVEAAAVRFGGKAAFTLRLALPRGARSGLPTGTIPNWPSKVSRMYSTPAASLRRAVRRLEQWRTARKGRRVRTRGLTA